MLLSLLFSERNTKPYLKAKAVSKRQTDRQKPEPKSTADELIECIRQNSKDFVNMLGNKNQKHKEA